MTRNQHKDVVDLLCDELFQLWLQGNADELTNQRWDRWVQDSTGNRELYLEAQQIWDAARYRPSPVPNVKAEWAKFQNRLSVAEEQRPEAAARLRPLRRHADRRKSHISYVLAVAAAILVAILLWTQNYFQTQFITPDIKTISSDFGETKTVKLPDNSSVILNANSTLIYPADWSTKANRHVRLKGEAFFSTTALQQESQHHFYVSTTDGVIRVVGTQFNVHNRGHGTQVALVEGRVEIHPAKIRNASQKEVKPIVVSPGEMVYFRKGEPQVRKKSEGIQPYISWWKDSIVLENTPFSEIIKRLEETYGVQIWVNDNRLLNRKLSGSVENTSPTVIIDALSKVLQVPVRQKDGIYIFGKAAS